MAKKLHIKTYGCQMNVYDSDRMADVLAPLGYGLLGDAIGITTTLAVVGLVVFLTIPLCLVLRPSIAVHGAPQSAAD